LDLKEAADTDLSEMKLNENTLESFDQSWREGPSWWEAQIRDALELDSEIKRFQVPGDNWDILEHDTLPNVKISSSIPSELAYLLLSTMLSTAPGLTHITFRCSLIDRISLPQSRLPDIFVMVDTIEDNCLSGKMITVRFKWKPPWPDCVELLPCLAAMFFLSSTLALISLSLPKLYVMIFIDKFNWFLLC
jgi:hypothetical protein